MTDRLAEIKMLWAKPEFHPPNIQHTLPASDIDWLVAEVERLRSDNAHLAVGLVELRERTKERERILKGLRSEVEDVKTLVSGEARLDE